MFLRQPCNKAVIDHPGFDIDSVLNRIEQLAREVDRASVGEVPALVQTHAENCIARIEQSMIRGRVGLGAGMGLNVCISRPEQFFGAFPGQLLCLVDKFATAVIPLPGIAFCILVGQHRTLGLHNPRAGIIF